MVELDLKGRKAFVTGGSRGIGAGICCVIADCGGDVVFTFQSDQKAADELAASLSAKNVRAKAIRASAENEDEMDLSVSEAAAFLEGIDILVANVGKNWVADVSELSIADWRRGVELNLTTAYIAVKLALPFLKQAPRADILLIGSSSVYDGGGGSPFYAASKAGMVGLMRSLMRELPKHKIRVNTIHPCVVDTDLLRSRYDTPEKIKKLENQVPLGRLSLPEDIGNLAAFLCSDPGGFITGQSILVDGGRTFWKK